MAYNIKIKDRVRSLRAKGETYSEIKKALSLSIPKSTLSSWCQNVALPIWYAKKVEELNMGNLKKGQQLSLASNRIKRESFLRSLKEQNKALTKHLTSNGVLKMLLSVLYLGEGSKWKSHRGLALGSSDPNIIKLYIRLLNICYN